MLPIPFAVIREFVASRVRDRLNARSSLRRVPDHEADVVLPVRSACHSSPVGDAKADRWVNSA